MFDNSYWGGWSSRGLVVHYPCPTLPLHCSCLGLAHGMVVPIAEFFTQWLAWLRVSKLKETDGRVLGEHVEAYTSKTSNRGEGWKDLVSAKEKGAAEC